MKKQNVRLEIHRELQAFIERDKRIKVLPEERVQYSTNVSININTLLFGKHHYIRQRPL